MNEKLLELKKNSKFYNKPLEERQKILEEALEKMREVAIDYKIGQEELDKIRGRSW